MGGIGIAIALLAGVVSFASPCCLPLVPAYVSYVVGTPVEAEVSRRWAAARQALAFVAGFTVVFVTLWASVGLVGYALRQHADLLRQIGAAVLIVMGLHVAGLIKISALYRDVRVPMNRARSVGYGKAALLGVLFAAGWTPCIGPVLGGIIGLASSTHTVGEGAVLLLAYALGLGIPFVLVAVGAEEVSRRLRWFTRHARAVEVVTGAMLIGMGFLMFTNLLVTVSGALPGLGI